MNLQAVVDRIEGDWAILLFEEEEIQVDFPLVLLPEDTKEGDHLQANFEIDHESTKNAEKRVTLLLDKLKKKTNDL